MEVHLFNTNSRKAYYIRQYRYYIDTYYIDSIFLGIVARCIASYSLEFQKYHARYKPSASFI